MRSKSDFWLTLHKLAHDLENEGGDANERIASTGLVLSSLCSATQQVYCGDVATALEVLTSLSAHCRTNGHHD
jgi:hypothetical protein